MPHLDPTTLAVRRYIADLNRGCPRCGDPHAVLRRSGFCDICSKDALAEAAREKLSHDEEVEPC